MIRKLFIFFIAITISSCASSKIYESNSYVGDEKYLYEMGISYLNSGNNALAIKYLEEALKSYDKPEVYNALALAYQFSGEFNKAEEIFKLGLNKYKDYPELLTNYGILLANQKKFDESIEYFNKAINHPTYSGKDKAYYNLGMVYLQLGKEDLFVYNLEKALMLNSNFVNAYIALGDYYFDKYNLTLDKEMLRKSRDLYSKALNFTINDPSIYFRIGKVYRKLGQHELAKYYLEKALRSAENNSQLKEEVRSYLLEIIDKPKTNLNFYNEKIKKEDSNNIINILEKGEK